jgi:hypothetical protein
MSSSDGPPNGFRESSEVISAGEPRDVSLENGDNRNSHPARRSSSSATQYKGCRKMNNIGLKGSQGSIDGGAAKPNAHVIVKGH